MFIKNAQIDNDNRKNVIIFKNFVVFTEKMP
jgi:hypothetical protein